jgi:hypothetical protein
MNNNSSQDLSHCKDFDIEEVTETSNDEEKNVVNACEIETWERLQVEKAKARPYITGIVISLWILCIITGLIRWDTTGDSSFLICSPVLLILPLRNVLKFYFTG